MRSLVVAILCYSLMLDAHAWFWSSNKSTKDTRGHAERRHAERSKSLDRAKATALGKYNSAYIPEYSEVGEIGPNQKEDKEFSINDSVFESGCSEFMNQQKGTPTCHYTLEESLGEIRTLGLNVIGDRNFLKPTNDALIAADVWHKAEIHEADRLINERKKDIECLEKALATVNKKISSEGCASTQSLFSSIKTNYAPVLTSLFLMNTKATVDKRPLGEMMKNEDGESFETEVQLKVQGILNEQSMEDLQKQVESGNAPEICHKPTGVKKADGIMDVLKLSDWNPRGKSCFKMKPFVIQGAQKYFDKVKGPLKSAAKIRAENRICNLKKSLPFQVKTAKGRNLVYENSVKDIYSRGVTDWQEPVYWRGVNASNMILQMDDPGIENVEELSENAPESVKKMTREKMMKSLLEALKKGADDDSINSPDEGIIPALRARKKKAEESLKNISRGYTGKSYTGDLDAPEEILSDKRKGIIDRYLSSIENDNNKHLACDVMTRNYLGMKARKHNWEKERMQLWTPWKNYGISYDDMYKAADSASNYALIGTMILAPPPFSTAANYIGMAKWGAANVKDQMNVQEAAEKAKGELDAKLSEIEKNKNSANMGSIGMLLWMGMSAGVLGGNAGGVSFRSQIDKAEGMLKEIVAPTGGKLTAESVKLLEKGTAEMMKSVGMKPIDILPEKLIGQTFEQAMKYTKSRLDSKLKIMQRKAVVRALGIVPATKTASDSEILSDYGFMKMEEAVEAESQKEKCSFE